MMSARAEHGMAYASRTARNGTVGFIFISSFRGDQPGTNSVHHNEAPNSTAGCPARFRKGICDAAKAPSSTDTGAQGRGPCHAWVPLAARLPVPIERTQPLADPGAPGPVARRKAVKTLLKRGFRMKQPTHTQKIAFATNFCWWFGSPPQADWQPASAGLSGQREARLKPAQKIKILTTRPPTEVDGKQGSCDAISKAQ